PQPGERQLGVLRAADLARLRAARRLRDALAQPALPVLDPRDVDPEARLARARAQHAVGASRPPRRQPRVPRRQLRRRADRLRSAVRHVSRRARRRAVPLRPRRPDDRLQPGEDRALPVARAGARPARGAQRSCRARTPLHASGLERARAGQHDRGDALGRGRRRAGVEQQQRRGRPRRRRTGARCRAAVNAAPAPLHNALRHGAIVAGFSAFIALALSIARGDWVLQLVYAEAIGLSIWACTELGRHGLGVDPQSGWRWAVLQVTAVVAGYAIGTGLGDLYCGCSSFEFFRRSPRTLASYLVLSVAITGAISYFFISRGRDQRRQSEIATAQRDAAEARLKLLESQLDQLIAFLRATLGASRVPFHALDAEFARVADYLALMQARMGPRLETKLDLPADLAALQVPPLVLQPLVENAIKHGLEPHVGKGRIEVRAVRDGNRVRLTVRDTGAGVAPGATSAGDAGAGGAGNGESTRFGLAQVRARLAAVYGTAASLELAPADDGEGGSRAVVTLPA